METETRFDLNAAILNWQQELAAQPGLSPVVRRELETHLRDTIAELQGRGLNNEEAFWLARRRTGMPRQLGEEFTKADPINAWRERTFWMVGALLAMNLWGALLTPFWIWNSQITGNRLEGILPVWVLFYLPDWLRNLQEADVLQILMRLANFLPIAVLAFFFARGRLKYLNGAISVILASRLRFFIAMCASFLLAHLFDFYSGGPGRLAEVLVFQFPWTVALIALATWLIPSKSRAGLQSA